MHLGAVVAKNTRIESGGSRGGCRLVPLYYRSCSRGKNSGPAHDVLKDSCLPERERERERRTMTQR